MILMNDGILTTVPVISPASNLLMAKSNDLSISTLIRCVISLFRSMDLPNNWTCRCRISVSYRFARGYANKYVPIATHSTRNRLSKRILQDIGWILKFHTVIHFINFSKENTRHFSFLLYYYNIWYKKKICRVPDY